MVTITEKPIVLNQKLEILANKIKDLLIANGLFEDTRIYFNDRCFDSEHGNIEGINPENYFEYANSNTLSISFEGPLYYVLNDYIVIPGFHETLVSLFESHGYYYQFGDAWNLTLYELNGECV